MNEIKNHQIIAMIPDDIFKQFKHVSVDLNKTMKDLLIEAMIDLVAKYHERNT